MRRITWLTILSLVLVFGIASSASAAELPKFQSDITNPMTYVGGNAGTSFTAGAVYGEVYNNGTDYSSPTVDAAYLTQLTSKLNPGAKLHSGYNSNTDACSACHVAHTAVGQTDLLQWANTTAACMACHDGTVTVTYDVNAGVVTGAKQTSAGKFGFSDAANVGHSAHAVAAVELNTAPGGNVGGTVADIYGSWGAVEFSCASCHAPHGTGGNGRILDPNTNGIATAKWNAYLATMTYGDGANLKVKIKTSATASKDAVLLTAGAGTEYSDTNTGNMKNWVNGSQRNAPVYAATYANASTATNNVALLYQKDYTIDSANGKVILSAAKKAEVTAGSMNVYALYIPALVVKMDVQNKLTVNEQVYYNAGMNAFCGACHTDYNVSSTSQLAIAGSSRDILKGEYTQAFRHNVAMTVGYKAFALKSEGTNAAQTTGLGKATCLTCHWAHGTDDTFSNVAYVAAYANYFGVATGEAALATLDITRSSALKRLPNMGVCENCHQKKDTDKQTW